jgi:integrase
VQFRKFVVRLPSGDRYWTVVDSGYRPVPEVDEWLLHLRLGRDRAESTTEAYATALAVVPSDRPGLAGTTGEFGRFVFWLRYYDPNATAGASHAVVRGERRINAVTAAVREFFKHAAAVGLVEKTVLDALYDLVEDYDLPAEVRGERATTRLRSRPRHRLSEPETVVDAASDEEVLALFQACRNARDRIIVLALWRIGNRRGELTGVRLEDVHFLSDSTNLGCRVKGPHLHVHRRDNSNGATAEVAPVSCGPGGLAGASLRPVPVAAQRMRRRPALRLPARQPVPGADRAADAPASAQRVAGRSVEASGVVPHGSPAHVAARVRHQPGRVRQHAGRDPRAAWSCFPHLQPGLFASVAGSAPDSGGTGGHAPVGLVRRPAMNATVTALAPERRVRRAGDAKRLAALRTALRPDLLAEAGWNADAEVLAPPRAHKQLGLPKCVVLDCEARVRSHGSQGCVRAAFRGSRRPA